MALMIDSYGNFIFFLGKCSIPFLKGNFIDIDPSIAHEIIEGIVGTLPQKGGSHPTQEETQVFEKICKVTIFLQKSLEPLKSVSGNLHRINMLITLCNKQLDSLDL